MIMLSCCGGYCTFQRITSALVFVVQKLLVVLVAGVEAAVRLELEYHSEGAAVPATRQLVQLSWFSNTYLLEQETCTTVPVNDFSGCSFYFSWLTSSILAALMLTTVCSTFVLTTSSTCHGTTPTTPTTASSDGRQRMYLHVSTLDFQAGCLPHPCCAVHTYPRI